MHLVVVGLSHKSAPLELRERFALDAPQAVDFGHRLIAGATVSEAVALSTCNRTELYLFADDTLAAEQLALARLAEHARVPVAELRANVYSHSGDAAIVHLFRVAASLDSMVVGEAQILAQIKEAYKNACGSGCTSTVFNKLFRQALEVGKRVRTETAIGERPVSVSSVAVDLAQQVLGKLERCAVTILGAGDTGELTVKNLRAHGIGDITVVNRTPEVAEELARRCGGRAAGFDEIERWLAGSDIVISSTSALGYVVDRAQVERALRARRHKPMMLIDIAVPRDLDPAIGRLENAFLYDIDDLQGVVEHNRGEREREAARAERIVAEELSRMNEWLAGLEVVPTIAQLRGAIDEIRAAELERQGRRMDDLSEEQRRQVDALTAAIVNKILHLPTVRMKEVARQKDAYVYVDVLRHLFGLNGSAPADDEEVRGGADRAERGEEGELGEGAVRGEGGKSGSGVGAGNAGGEGGAGTGECSEPAAGAACDLDDFEPEDSQGAS